ncbi:MAG: serine/threonine-protein kinase [Gemmatimonadales bacterium]
MSTDLTAQLGTLSGYRIERELGGGGMSRVFLAEEIALGRRVAIKVLESQGTHVDADRFQQEILLSARLQHPHIVPLLSAGQVEERPYYVMPFVEGESLRARLRRDDQLPIGEAIRLLGNVAAALAYAHARGIVHRDIKPDNIILTGGLAVVVDFGVSKALAASAAAAPDNMTSAGLTIGTPRYMAPEQAVGDPNIDARVDLYAWGITAYEMLTGATPFGGADPVKILRAHLMEDPAPIAAQRSGIPPGIARLVMRCLEKDRSRRPASAGEILDALEVLATTGNLRAITLESARSWVSSIAVPVLLYLLASGAMIAGFRWLLNEGQIGMRLMVLSVVVALLGLPVVVAVGLILRLRAAEGR